MDADDPVCLKCIGDVELRRLLSEAATRAVCASCGQRRQAVSVRDVALRVDEVYRQYYELGGEVARFDQDSDNPFYEQEGDDPQSIIQEMAEVEPDIAEAIAECLNDDEWYSVAKGGGTAAFDDSSRYVKRDLPPVELKLEWAEFCRRIQHRRRFFDDEARRILATILGERASIASPDNPISRCIAVLKKGERVCRARRTTTRATAERIIADPPRELGPPPLSLATSGRMNPSGIAVFYGGFSEDVCVAEVRPDVGGFVVVGQFQTTRRLRLLDLTLVGQRWFPGSMFRADYYERTTKRRFLLNFQSLISRAVQPHEEAIEYIPTRVVAEYISNVLGLDGIIYASAQLGGVREEDDEPPDRTTQNVALFNRASVVAGTQRRTTRRAQSSHRVIPPIDWEEGQDVNRLPSPSLRFVRNSARAVHITGIKVSCGHE